MPTIEDMSAMLLATIPWFIKIIIYGSYIVGTVLIAVALVSSFRLAVPPENANDKDHHLLSKLLIMFAVGAALIYFPSTIDAGTQTFVGDSNDMLSYNSSVDKFYGMAAAGYLFIKLVGVGATSRGIYLFRVTPYREEQFPIAKAMTYFFSGILCINSQPIIETLFYYVSLTSQGGQVAWLSAMTLACILGSLAVIVDLWHACNGSNPNADKSARQKENNDEQRDRNTEHG